VTGLERGIASSMSYEAKARGVTRGMRISDIRRTCPEAVILSSDYDTYAIYARRMYEIVRAYTPLVEEYSIDECFADLTGLEARLGMSYAEMAAAVKHDLETYLGLSFSVGLSVNKVTAKIASKWRKPSGLTVISADDLPRYLAELPVGKLWGIGPSTVVRLRKQGIVTALDLSRKERSWVAEWFDQPVREIYEELRGNFVMPVSVGEGAEDHRSIQRTRTFRPPSRDRSFVFSELSHNIEEACRRLRDRGLSARHASFFLKTQEFRYSGAQISLPDSVSTPAEILALVRPRFDAIFQTSEPYRATGITLSGLERVGSRTSDLFGTSRELTATESLYRTVDRLSLRHGEQAIFLASSLRAVRAEGRTERRFHFNLPFLGQVR
jgi:DNA polymerase-4